MPWSIIEKAKGKFTWPKQRYNLPQDLAAMGGFFFFRSMKFPDLKSESSPMIYLENLDTGKKNIGDKKHGVSNERICVDVPRSR